jgi:uncharacterized protein (DUF486 family)
MRGLLSILLLIVSNAFMTYAWYGHLFLRKSNPILTWGVFGLIIFSWGIAFFEYIFQVPANRLGHENFGGPFTLFQLKIIQEVISLSVFIFMAIFLFKAEKFSLNYLISFIFLLLAVVFAFRK